MIKKKCLCCEKLYEPSRSDSKFCSTTCRTRHWAMKQKKKGILNGIVPTKKTDDPPIENKPEFKGIDAELLEPCDNLIDGLKPNTDEDLNPQADTETSGKENEEEQEIIVPDQYITSVKTTINPAYLSCSEELNNCRTSIGVLNKCLQTLDIHIEKNNSEYWNNLWLNSEKANEYKAKAEKAKKLKEENLRLLGLNEEKKTKLQQELILHPAEFQTEEKKLNPDYTKALNIMEEKIKLKAAKEKQTQVNKNTSKEEEKEQPDLSSEDELENNQLNNEEDPKEKIIPADQLGKKTFKRLNFSGKWKLLLNQPSPDFSCVVHGMSFNGKTTFCLQFARYLALNFGNVLFVSSEEGTGYTLQKKIKELGSMPKRLFIGDFSSVEELLTEVPNKYHFIFIDSLDNMHIGPEEMKAIRKKFYQSGLIAICQNTKTGKMTGSNKIAHDCNIGIEVKTGIATVFKNRFKEDESVPYDIFAALNNNKKPNKGLDEDFDNTV